MSITEQTFEELVLNDPERQWELHHGRPREKPNMSIDHHRVTMRLNHQFGRQLDLDRFDLRLNLGHVRRVDQTYYIPDLYIVPIGSTEPLPGLPDQLEVWDIPLLLVVEVWSPSTGTYDVASKLPEYQLRGDQEIWRVHPFDRTLMAWRRQQDGSDALTMHTEGSIQPIALPGVTIDLDALFA